MDMKRAFLYILVALTLLGCGRKPMQVVRIESEILPVDSSLDAVQDSAYLAYLAPVAAELEEQLSIPLGTAPEALSVGKPESTLLNWASDALKAKADENFVGKVDFAVVNAGGLRCDWAAGDITFRNVFELMPFDNELVILTLSGEDVLLVVQNCIEQGGQGVSKELHIDAGNQAQQATLHGLPIDPTASYHVATSDYLSGGADGLTALTHFSERVMTGKKIRDLYIEYIQEIRIVEAKLDGRMKL